MRLTGKTDYKQIFRTKQSQAMNHGFISNYSHYCLFSESSRNRKEIIQPFVNSLFLKFDLVVWVSLFRITRIFSSRGQDKLSLFLFWMVSCALRVFAKDGSSISCYVVWREQQRIFFLIRRTLRRNSAFHDVNVTNLIGVIVIIVKTSKV